jgi:hypothetical protein
LEVTEMAHGAKSAPSGNNLTSFSALSVRATVFSPGP